MEQLQAYHHLSSQIRILYDQSIITFLFPVIAAPAVCLLLWDVSERSLLTGWTGIVIVYSLARYLLIWKQKQVNLTPENANFWLDIFTASVFISGLLWGAASIILVPYETHRIIEFTIYNSLTMLIVCGLVAGAVVAYSVSRRVIFFYAFPALIPPSVYLVILGDKNTTFLGGFVFLYFIFVIALSLRLNRQFSHYIGIEFEMIQISYRLSELQAKQR